MTHMKKTLGGDRLGSGKKMKVDLHGYERSTHDIGQVLRTSMAAGTLVPFFKRIAMPGDTLDINLEGYMNTLPTIGPLFGSYKWQLDVFMAPIRLYHAMLTNNTLNVGLDMAKIKLPQIRLTALPFDATTVADIDNAQVNPSCLLSYLGLRGIGYVDGEANKTRDFNALAILMYWDTYKNYYANKQEEIGAVIHTAAVANTETIDQINIINGATETVLPEQPATPGSINLNPTSTFKIEFTGATPKPEEVYINTSISGWVSADLLGLTWQVTAPGIMAAMYNFAEYGTQQATEWRYRDSTDVADGTPKIATFPLENIDLMKKEILSMWDDTAPLIINDADLAPYKWLHEQPAGIPNILSSQEGLALKTYNSDLFNNWLKTENIAAISNDTAVDTSAGFFTQDQLLLSKKLFDMMNRIAVSGGSYDDWIGAVYDHEPYKKAGSPIYMGGLIKELIFQEVISNSETDSQPLGTLAGKGMLAQKNKGGSMIIKVDEPSIIMGIMSLTPRIDYSQGNDWDLSLQTMDDIHKPGLDQLGFQDLITEQMHWADTIHNGTEWIQKSAGKQPAWINYMTDINKTKGNFAVANKEMFMTLNRRYEIDTTATPEIKDLTTYIDPSKFNYIFAQTKLDAQNFWAQVGINITARRKMSAKIMPNL